MLHVYVFVRTLIIFCNDYNVSRYVCCYILFSQLLLSGRKKKKKIQNKFIFFIRNAIQRLKTQLSLTWTYRGPM